MRTRRARELLAVGLCACLHAGCGGTSSNPSASASPSASGAPATGARPETSAPAGSAKPPTRPPKGGGGSPTGEPPASAPLPPPVETAYQPPATVPIGECKAATDSIGGWRPTVRDVVTAARAIAGATCLEPEALAAALATCAAQVTSAVCEVESAVPRYSACQHSVRALEWQGRTWIKIRAFLGEQATFFQMVNILELKDGRALRYFAGDEGGSDLCGGSEGQAHQTSIAMRSDWPNLPEDVRKDFFCGQASAAPPPPPSGPSKEDDALAFFKSKVNACAAAAGRAEGATVLETRPNSLFVLRDANGQRMLVHLSARLIYGPGGPQGVMPRPYLNCASDVFVGTMDE